MNAIKLPGQYAKFITVLLGQVLVYFQTFGWVWDIKPAATMAGVALAVLAVPNTPKAAAVVPVRAPAGNVTITSPPVAPVGNVTITPPPTA